MRMALFGTGTPEQIKTAIAQIREHFKEAELTLYVRDAFRPHLEGCLDGIEIENDHLRGRALQFAKDVRARRFETLAVIFAGGKDHWKVKLMAFASGARHLYVFNENGNFFEWNRESLPIIKQHVSNRVRNDAMGMSPDGGSWLAAFERIYSLTVGPILGLGVLLAKAVWLETRRGVRRLLS